MASAFDDPFDRFDEPLDETPLGEEVTMPGRLPLEVDDGHLHAYHLSTSPLGPESAPSAAPSAEPASLDESQSVTTSSHNNHTHGELCFIAGPPCSGKSALAQRLLDLDRAQGNGSSRDVDSQNDPCDISCMVTAEAVWEDRIRSKIERKKSLTMATSDSHGGPALKRQRRDGASAASDAASSSTNAATTTTSSTSSVSPSLQLSLHERVQSVAAAVSRGRTVLVSDNDSVNSEPTRRAFVAAVLERCQQSKPKIKKPSESILLVPDSTASSGGQDAGGPPITFSLSDDPVIDEASSQEAPDCSIVQITVTPSRGLTQCLQAHFAAVAHSIQCTHGPTTYRADDARRNFAALRQLRLEALAKPAHSPPDPRKRRRFLQAVTRYDPLESRTTSSNLFLRKHPEELHQGDICVILDGSILGVIEHRRLSDESPTVQVSIIRTIQATVQHVLASSPALARVIVLCLCDESVMVPLQAQLAAAEGDSSELFAAQRCIRTLTSFWAHEMRSLGPRVVVAIASAPSHFGTPASAFPPQDRLVGLLTLSAQLISHSVLCPALVFCSSNDTVVQLLDIAKSNNTLAQACSLLEIDASKFVNAAAAASKCDQGWPVTSVLPIEGTQLTSPLPVEMLECPGRSSKESVSRCKPDDCSCTWDVVCLPETSLDARVEVLTHPCDGISSRCSLGEENGTQLPRERAVRGGLPTSFV